MTHQSGRPARRVERDLQAIGALTQAVLDSDDADALLARVAQEAQRLVAANATMVITIDGEPEIMTVRAMVGVSGGPLAVGSTSPLADAPTAQLVHSGTILVRRSAQDASATARELMNEYNIGAVVGVPIASGGVSRGMLFVGKAADAAPFRQPEIQLIATFANQAANAIHLSELRSTEARLTVGIEQDRIARDLHDGVVQSLYGLGMGLRASIARSPDTELVPIVTEVLGRLDDAIIAVRDYIAMLEVRVAPAQDLAFEPQRRGPAPQQHKSPRPVDEDGLPRDVIAALGSLAEASLANEKLESVLLRLVNGVVERSEAAFGILGTLTEDATALRVRAVAGRAIVGRETGAIVPLGETLASEAIRRGRPIVVSSPQQASRTMRQNLERMDMGPTVAVPLSVRGRVFGGLAVGRNPGSPRFSQSAVNMIEAHAVQAAIALEFDRVRQELRRAVVIEERRRVGVDLHDRVIQMLFGIGLTLQSHEGATRDAATRATLRSAVDSMDRTIRDLRRYVFDLGRSLPVDRSLEDELRALASDLVAETSLMITIDIDPALSGMVADPAGEILQVAREAVSNVIQHAEADHCLVKLASKGGRVVLEVIDDGRGVPVSSETAGHGLRNMRTRAAAVGGRVEIRRNQPRGTVVRFTAPITRGQ